MDHQSEDVSKLVAKIWVTQEGNNDYSSAEKFGEVEFITKTDLRNMPDCQQNKNVAHDILRFKSVYIPGTDYIIPAGNPVLTAQVVLSLPKGSHKFLKWDGRRGEYIPFTIKGI